jgi:hypothetical protein
MCGLIRSRALAWVNRHRARMGHVLLDELLCGDRGRNDSCPLSNSLGGGDIHVYGFQWWDGRRWRMLPPSALGLVWLNDHGRFPDLRPIPGRLPAPAADGGRDPDPRLCARIVGA